MADDTQPHFLTTRSTKPVGWEPWTDPDFKDVTRAARYALFYAAVLGWPVFPVGPNKSPLIPEGHYGSTLDLDQIVQWFDFEFVGREPGIGFAPALGELAVVDIDVKRKDGVVITDGHETLKNLRIHLPPTFVSITQSGDGEHHFYTMPEGGLPSTVGVNGLGKGLDTRAAHWDKPKSASGYVILPPSAGLTGLEYAWKVAPSSEHFPPPVVPEQVVLTVRESQSRKGATTAASWEDDEGREVKKVHDPEAYVRVAIEQSLAGVAEAGDGGRNVTLNKCAFSIGRMIGTGYAEMDRDDAYAALLAAAPIASDFTEQEVRGVLDHALDEGIERAPKLVTRLDEMVDLSTLQSADELLDDTEDSPEEVEDSAPDPYEASVDDEPIEMDDLLGSEDSVDTGDNDNIFDASRLDLTTLLTDGVEAVDALIPDVIWAGHTHALNARGGSGKSFFVQWACVELARQKKHVLYLDEENPKKIIFDRIHELIEPEELKSIVKYLHYYSFSAVNWMKEETPKMFGALLDRLKIEMVIVDSLVDILVASGITDENDNLAAKGVISALDKMTKTRNIALVFLDHTTKDGMDATGRGAGAKHDALDYAWKVGNATFDKHKSGHVRLKRVKNRGGEAPEEVKFKVDVEPRPDHQFELPRLTFSYASHVEDSDDSDDDHDDSIPDEVCLPGNIVRAMLENAGHVSMETALKHTPLVNGASSKCRPLVRAYLKKLPDPAQPRIKRFKDGRSYIYWIEDPHWDITTEDLVGDDE